MPKTNAKTPKTRANINANGVKAKTMIKNSNFMPTINNSIAIKISMKDLI
jgi:hypothetical protein